MLFLVDPVVSNRYHCSHHGGVHTVTLTWLDNHHQLLGQIAVFVKFYRWSVLRNVL